MLPLALWAAMDNELKSSGCQWVYAHGSVMHLPSIRTLGSLRWPRRNVQEEISVEGGLRDGDYWGPSHHPSAAESLCWRPLPVQLQEKLPF